MFFLSLKTGRFRRKVEWMNECRPMHVIFECVFVCTESINACVHACSVLLNEYMSLWCCVDACIRYDDAYYASIIQGQSFGFRPVCCCTVSIVSLQWRLHSQAGDTWLTRLYACRCMKDIINSMFDRFFFMIDHVLKLRLDSLRRRMGVRFGVVHLMHDASTECIQKDCQGCLYDGRVCMHAACVRPHLVLLYMHAWKSDLHFGSNGACSLLSFSFLFCLRV